jgi:hypothetical protein
VFTIEGSQVTDKELRVLESGETPRFSARPDYATVGLGSHWMSPLLLLTDRRLLVSKDRLFGTPRADFAVQWSAVSDVNGMLWNGGGPKIQLIVSSAKDTLELIVEPQYAPSIESTIRACSSER